MKPRLRTLNEMVNRLADDYLSQDDADEYLLREFRSPDSCADADDDMWYERPDREAYREALGL